jgi:hypothetical protein
VAQEQAGRATARRNAGPPSGAQSLAE